MTRSQWPASTAGGNKFILAHLVLELVKEHAVNLHALKANGLFLDRGENVRAQVIVNARLATASTAAPTIVRVAAFAFGTGKLNDLS